MIRLSSCQSVPVQVAPVVIGAAHSRTERRVCGRDGRRAASQYWLAGARKAQLGQHRQVGVGGGEAGGQRLRSLGVRAVGCGDHRE
jgi:hypothetical protein